MAYKKNRFCRCRGAAGHHNQIIKPIRQAHTIWSSITGMRKGTFPIIQCPPDMRAPRKQLIQIPSSVGRVLGIPSYIDCTRSPKYYSRTAGCVGEVVRETIPTLTGVTSYPLPGNMSRYLILERSIV